MDTLQAIQTRRAIKRFDPGHPMAEATVNQLLRLTLLSPTAFNLQPWRFVVVRDAEQRRRVRSVAGDQPQFTDASLLVVLCADIRAWEKAPRRYWREAPEEVARFMEVEIDRFYRGRETLQRDEAMRACGIAAQTLMLAATALGYQSCPMAGFDRRALGEILALPDDHLIGLAVAIGKGIQAPRPRPGQLALEEVVVIDRF